MPQQGWTWALGALLCLALEAGGGGAFVFVFFAAAAIVVAALISLGVLSTLGEASLAFAALSALMLATVRRPLMRRGSRRPGGTGASAGTPDAFVGASAAVEVAMAPGATGHVMCRGTVWSARNVGPLLLETGARAEVVAADNLTLCVATPSGAPRSP
jgi:membrane protein implicated in regulation of membrane protease activity